MRMQHKVKPNKIAVVSREEQHTNLCCNNVGLCCSSLDVTNEQQEKSKQELLEELADIFILGLKLELENEREKEGGAVLPSVNERTS